ncbi:MAG: 30S ribosome-binding factor RbfA [Bacteroidia bacterium]
MASTRQLKVERLLQKELSEIFRLESTLHYQGAMISVTVVRISPDLSFAKVYVSIFYPKGDKMQIFEMINENYFHTRHKLGERIGKQLRIVPELAFYLDDSLDYAAKIDELLKK